MNNKILNTYVHQCNFEQFYSQCWHYCDLLIEIKRDLIYNSTESLSKSKVLSISLTTSKEAAAIIFICMYLNFVSCAFIHREVHSAVVITLALYAKYAGFYAHHLQKNFLSDFQKIFLPTKDIIECDVTWWLVIHYPRFSIKRSSWDLITLLLYMSWWSSYDLEYGFVYMWKRVLTYSHRA